jgi:L,D-transpeptidase YcbB
MIKSSVSQRVMRLALTGTLLLPVTFTEAVINSGVSFAQENSADSFLERLRKKRAAKLAAKQKAAADKKAFIAAPKPVVTQDSAAPSLYDEDTPSIKPRKKIAAVPPAAQSNFAQDDHNAPVASGSKVNTVTEIVESKNVSPTLFADSASVLSDAATRYRAIVANGGFPKVPRSSLKRNSKGKAVVALNKRLYAEGYLRVEATEGKFAEIYTTATEDAVRRYQQNMGLSANGKFNGALADIMNVPADVRLRTIEANIARLAEYTKDLSDRYVVVNVPAQQLETVNGGRVYSRHNAIVGRPARPTPVAMTALSDINFNPYWNAPVSIVERDLFPKMASTTQILDDMNIRVFQGFGGPEVDPSTVDWKTARADDYHFRQEPGEGNAMATAKINFPSPFGIYLHDTPEKQLFNSSQRFYSSGCVRVQDIPVLLNWILNGQEGLGQAEIATLAETLERKDVSLVAPPQLRVVYLTAWPSKSGTVSFRNDVYELDGTGFVTGQPMPVGELSPDGQRFVTKPIPRLAAQVDDASGGGAGSFSTSPTKKLLGTEKPAAAKLKPAPEADATTKVAPKKAVTKIAEPSAAEKKKPGFDFAKWRKEQAALAEKKKADAAKKIAAKPAAAKAESKKVAVVEKPKAVETKPIVAKAKPKPADCKPLKDGKLPKDCAPVVEAKKLTKPIIKPAAKPAEKTAAN